MKLSKIQSFRLIWTLLLVIAVAAGSSVAGQGKGHDKKSKGNAKSEQFDRGGKQQKADKPGRGNQRADFPEQRRQVKAERGQISDQRRQTQDVTIQRDSRRQEVPSGWVDRSEQAKSYKIDRPKQKKNKADKYERENAKRYNREARRDAKQPRYQDERRIVRDRRASRNNDGYRQAYPVYPNRPNSAWPNNYGDDRSREVHQRNAEKKALKDERKAYKKWAKENKKWAKERYKNSDDYYERSRYDGYGNYRTPIETRRTGFLRSIVESVFSNNARNYYEPQYRGYDYGIPYAPDYNGSYYEPYPTYQRAPNDRYYGSQQYPYDPRDVGSTYPASYANGIDLPFLTDSPVGGFIANFFGRLVELGYNQGYIDAQNTRSNGYDETYYPDRYDPYVYDADGYQDIGYDPYSSLGENQRYLNEGYELGYRDALDGQTQFDPYGNGGGVDLVSLLIGNLL